MLSAAVVIGGLTFTTLGNSADNKLTFLFFLTFPRKQDLTFPLETICLKCQILFLRLIKKKCCLLKILPRVVHVSVKG